MSSVEKWNIPNDVCQTLLSIPPPRHSPTTAAQSWLVHPIQPPGTGSDSGPIFTVPDVHVRSMLN